MNEDEVQKKLEEIKRSRAEHRLKARQCPLMTAEEEEVAGGASPVNRDPSRPLTDEEITARMAEWRSRPDPTCEACGICSIENADPGDKSDENSAD